MNPYDYFKDGSVMIWKDVYSVYKVHKAFSGAFATIADHTEITVIAKTGTVETDNILAEEAGWKILTFNMVLPFELVGFLAVVAKVLADENISIFALSSYSTDHILVKEKDLPKTIQKMTELGAIVTRSDVY
jgi:uncharacterized protein